MDDVKIEATERSPEIDFQFVANRFAFRGESYPEDVAAFYGPLMNKLESHLATVTSGTVEFDFELIYFNSSSAKVLMDLFDRLESLAASGVAVTINWHYDAEDDTMEELGEDFAEDLEHAKFELRMHEG